VSVDERLARIGRNIAAELQLPVAVDFFLIVAVEDGADGESDTYYPTVSSRTSHYRKVGLVRTAQRILLRDDDEEDDG
jgi:hypothetical protein